MSSFSVLATALAAALFKAILAPFALAEEEEDPTVSATFVPALTQLAEEDPAAAASVTAPTLKEKEEGRKHCGIVAEYSLLSFH